MKRKDFLREGAPDPDTVKMPVKDIGTNDSPRDLEELLSNLGKIEEDRAMYPWAERFVMGYPLPHWQRDFKWNEFQQRAFIDSIWRGNTLSSYLVNDWAMSDGVTFDRFSNVLLDGQQRLFTIERFVTGQLAVPDGEGKLTVWGEIGKHERRRFARTIFTKSIVRIWDEAVLCDIYNRRNYGGTPHLESERARPSGV
jgi:hypothetical protein